MDGRLAAPQDVVVHAGQVVVNQRVDMAQLDGGSDLVYPCRIGSRGFTSGVGQQRPHPFAPAENRIAHGLVQTPRRDGHRRQDGLEDGLHPFLVSAHPGLKVSRRNLHQGNRARIRPPAP